jgi:hypothetical protein
MRMFSKFLAAIALTAVAVSAQATTWTGSVSAVTVTYIPDQRMSEAIL